MFEGKKSNKEMNMSKEF